VASAKTHPHFMWYAIPKWGSDPYTWTVLTMVSIQLKETHNPELISFFSFISQH